MTVQEYRDLMAEVWDCRDSVVMAVTADERDREVLRLELKIGQLQEAKCRTVKDKDLLRAANILAACLGMLQGMPKLTLDGSGTLETQSGTLEASGCGSSDPGRNK